MAIKYIHYRIADQQDVTKAKEGLPTYCDLWIVANAYTSQKSV